MNSESEHDVICPYCLSQISSKAWVCKVCTREVKLLFSVMRENDLLRNGNAGHIKTPPEKIVAIGGHHFPLGILLVLYLLISMLYSSLLIYLFPDPFPFLSVNIFMYQLPTIFIIPVVTWLVLKYAQPKSIWIVALFGALQPVLTAAVTPAVFESLAGIRSITHSVVIFGAEFLLAGVPLCLAMGASILSFYSYKPVVQYLTQWNDRYESASKLISFVGTIVTFVFILSKAL